MTIPGKGSAVNIFDLAEEICARLGIEIPKNLNTDDRIYRTSTTDGRKHNKNGAIKLFSDGRGGIAWNWKAGESETFFVGGPAHQLTEAERAEIAKRRKEAAEALQRQYEAAAAKARRIWDGASPASQDHPYLKRKGVQPHGVRERWGKLIIPVYGDDKSIISVQMIAPDGQKRFLKGASNDGIFIINAGRKSGPVLTVEGFATGASAAEAMAATVVCAFNSSMLGKAAQRIMASSDRPVMICADNDHTAGKSEEMARQAGAMFAIPDFEGFERSDKDTDFNDLATLAGVPEVAKQIRYALKTGVAQIPKDNTRGEETPNNWHEDHNADSQGSARQYVNGLDLKPLKWEDPATLPRRPFIYGSHYQRRYVGITAAPGGTGKTALIMAEILSMVVGKRLLYNCSKGKKRVWYIGEDDQIEIKRRFFAAMKRYAIPGDAIDGLFIHSFRDIDLTIDDGNEPQAEAKTKWKCFETRQSIIDAIKLNGIDVVVLDHFARTHRVPENDNVAIGRVMKAWIDIAEKSNSAIDLIMHSRKAVFGLPNSTDSVRGASAMRDNARSVRVIEIMSKDEGEKMNINESEWYRYIRVVASKPNMAKRSENQWYHLDDVCLSNEGPDDPDNSNADQVQVASVFRAKGDLEDMTPYTLDQFMRAIQSGDYQSKASGKKWAGYLLISAARKEKNSPSAKKWATRILNNWISNGVLIETDRKNEHYEIRKYLELGEYKFSTPAEKLDEDIF